MGSSPIKRTAPRFARLEAALWLVAAFLVAPQAAVMAARGGLSFVDGPIDGHVALPVTAPDSTWSAKRRAEFQRFSRGLVPQPAGYLTLPDHDLRIPIFDGDGELALTLGAGHLHDTAPLTSDGNAAIAGHRDGFFRVLRSVAIGDRLTVEAAGTLRAYRITDQWVVAPEDVWVLDPTPEPSLTLITCYPFYYAGNAPERFIVRAVLIDGSIAPSRAKEASAAEPSSNPKEIES
jgi:sortase A